MSAVDSYIGEIRPIAFNYAPQGWLICDGSKVSISAYQNLYALIGQIYGGDGVTTFALPDLRGRVPIGMGTGTSALTPRTIGQLLGAETVKLDVPTIPAHTHSLQVSSANGNLLSPKDAFPAATIYKNYFNNSAGPYKEMDTLSVSNSGADIAHNNMMPFMALNYIINYDGSWPQRQQ